MPLGAVVASALVLLSAHGIGSVRFGLSKERAVEQLSALFGQPSRRFVNNGCGSRYTEVAWAHLYAEFRAADSPGSATSRTAGRRAYMA